MYGHSREILIWVICVGGSSQWGNPVQRLLNNVVKLMVATIYWNIFAILVILINLLSNQNIQPTYLDLILNMYLLIWMYDVILELAKFS